jgi:S1-C subfamily serine protease
MAIENLLDLSEKLSALAEQGGKSVVRVDSRRAPSSGVVWSADGVVLTANHNVEWDENLEVGLPDGRAVPAEIVGRDPTTDLAALRVSASGLAAPSWSEQDSLKTGHLLLGLTRPGKNLRAGLGLLARVADAWRTPAGGKLDRYVETDLPLHPGFSGGLILDLAGRTVGLATAGLARGTAMVVPVPTLRRVAKALLTHGGVRRGFLGIATIPIRLPPQLEKQAGQGAALLVTAVEEDSPAARGGLLVGDVLLSLDGRPVSHVGDLLPALEEERIGDAAPARVLRAGSLLDMTLTIGAHELRQGRGGR